MSSNRTQQAGRQKTHHNLLTACLSLLLLTLLPLDAAAQFKNNEWVGKNGPGRKGGGKAGSPIEVSLPQDFIFKANLIGGYIIPTSKNLMSMPRTPVAGGEIAIEFPSWRGYAWQQYLGDPALGLGLGVLDLGNRDILGFAVAAYPYLLIHIVDLPHFQLNYKGGVGLSFFNKRFSTADTADTYRPTANAAIGSVVNVYINTGANLHFPIKRGFAINADIAYSHMSNGSMKQPNGGINMLYAGLGATYTLQRCTHCRKAEKDFQPLPYRWAVSLAAAGGYRELFFRDHHGFAIGSLHAGATYNITNWYAVGGGVDAFYDGVFRNQGVTKDMTPEQKAEQHKTTLFGRYYLPENRAANKVRVGIGVNNVFLVGRVALLLDWGFYLYDPIRNAYLHEHPRYGRHRPMFYAYDIEKEDGWNYFRLGIRCRVWDNLHLQASIKTHLQKAEMLEWGVAYTIPFTRRDRFGSVASKNPSIIYHPAY